MANSFEEDLLLEVRNEKLSEVLDGILDTAKQAREQSDSYKKLFHLSKEESIETALRKADHEMTRIALDLAHVLESKYNKKTTNEKFDVLQALPYIIHRLTEDIRKKEGNTCCVDKAFFLVNKLLLDL